MTLSQTNAYKFGDFILHTGEHTLRKNGREIRLRPKAFDTLIFLVERSGSLVRKEDLLRNIWPDVIVSENTLSHCVDEVRNALDDKARSPDFIETVPSLGFKFIADVEQWPKEANTNAISDFYNNPSLGSTGDYLKRRIRRKRFFTGAIIIILFIIIALWAEMSLKEDHQKNIAIAVLPFVNLNGDPKQDYFADGMTEALTAGLSRVTKLPVISRTSVMRYKNTDKSLTQIAEELSVDMLIEGSVLRDSNRVRIIVQLIQARTDEHIWASSFEKKESNILTLQDDLVQAIAAELKLELMPQKSKKTVLRNKINESAYDAYLKGRYFLSNRSLNDIEKSIDFFTQAIEIDSVYADAYVASAKAYVLLSFMGEYPGRITMSYASEMSHRALRLDDTLAEAHLILAYIKMHYDWDWSAADHEFKRAFKLNPGNATAYHFYAMYLAAQCDFNVAIKSIKQALQLDPFSAIINTHHAWFYYLQGDNDDAINYFRKTLDTFPYFSFARLWLAMAYLENSMHQEAETCLNEAFSEWPDNPRLLSMLGYTYAAGGKTNKASEILKKLITSSDQRFISGFDIAIVYIGLGDTERAFQWLEKAYQDREPLLVLIKATPLFTPIKSNPRYDHLLERIGLN